jgi:hypothetical protein
VKELQSLGLAVEVINEEDKEATLGEELTLTPGVGAALTIGAEQSEGRTQEEHV